MVWRSPDGFYEHHHLDRRDFVGKESDGKDRAEDIVELGLTLPKDAKYLALGCGQGKKERLFAETLGIKKENTTWVDRRWPHSTVEQFNAAGYTENLVERDIFAYLETPRPEKFDLVSGFSIEYAFETPQELERLIKDLADNVNPNGIIHIFPGNRELKGQVDSYAVWNKYGFKNLRDYQDEHLLTGYLMRKEPQLSGKKSDADDGQRKSARRKLIPPASKEQQRIRQISAELRNKVQAKKH
jgi:SAM-dependent methyltransferase